jgi:hypothetical protein
MIRYRKWPARLAMLLTAAVLVDIVLRHLLPPLTPPVFRDEQQASTLELRSGASAVAHMFSRDITISVDAQGHRTTAGAPVDGAGRHILDVVGDSQVFGWGLSDDETVPSRLQASLGASWKIVNHGVPGFGPWQYRDVMNSIPVDHQVVLILTEENDLYDSLDVGLASSYCGYMSTGLAERFGLPCAVLDSRLLQGLQESRAENAILPTPIGFTTSSTVVASVAASRITRWIDAERARRGQRLLVSVVPWRGRLHPQLRRSYFPEPDAVQQVFLPDDAGMRARFAQVSEPVSLYLRGDSHLSPVGARQLAGGVAEALRGAGVMVASGAGGAAR